MAITAYPKAATPMLEAQWSQILQRIYHGVDGGTSLQITADGGGLRVFAAAGRAGVLGHGCALDSQEQISIDAGDSLARIDTVVLRLDYSQDPIIDLAVVKGTPGGSAPSLDPGGSVVARLALADVAVAASAVTISPGDVTDRRRTVEQSLSAAVAALDASAVTSGQLPVARGGTGAGTAAAARTSLGASTVGGQVFTAASAAAARSALGAGAVGGAVFEAPTKTPARTSLGISSGTADPSGGEDGDIYFKIVG